MNDAFREHLKSGGCLHQYRCSHQICAKENPMSMALAFAHSEAHNLVVHNLNQCMSALSTTFRNLEVETTSTIHLEVQRITNKARTSDNPMSAVSLGNDFKTMCQRLTPVQKRIILLVDELRKELATANEIPPNHPTNQPPNEPPNQPPQIAVIPFIQTQPDTTQSTH